MIYKRYCLLTVSVLLLSLAHGCMAFVPRTLDNGYRIITLNADRRIEVYFDDPQLQRLAAAAAINNKVILERLIADGADVNAVGRQGMTPLIWALHIALNLEGAKTLLQLGADPNLISDDDRAVLQLAAAYAPTTESLRLLLENGGNPNLVVAGRPLLAIAASTDRLDAIEMLLSFGADINNINQLGHTVFLSEVLSSDFDIALYLLDQGADPHINDPRIPDLLVRVLNRDSANPSLNAVGRERLRRLKAKLTEAGFRFDTQ